MMSRISIIGAACGLGAIDRGCALGPDALRQLGLARALASDQGQAAWRAMVRPRAITTDAAKLASIQALCRELAGRVTAAVRKGERFAVVGGDHACAIGTWTGAYSALCDRRQLGLVWIDAHMDSHTPQTSPSGAMHGMPLAALLGYGHAVLTDLVCPRPKLLPQHLCLLGIRSYESDEAKLLRRLGVPVIFMDEINAQGLSAAFDEAVQIACDGTAGFGISVDLDAVDPVAAPGVGSPAPGGLHGGDLIKCLTQVAAYEGLLGIEVAELNPQRDSQRRTALLARDLLHAGLKRIHMTDRKRIG